MNRIPVYFVPGFGANSLIFEFINIPEDEFECIYLEWEIPADKENISEYARRMSERVTHENPVLIGVSLGEISNSNRITCRHRIIADLNFTFNQEQISAIAFNIDIV